MTMRHILLPLAALAAWTFAPAGLAAADEPPQPGMERMQHWAADHEALLDAGLAGLKAGLKLTSDQDKLWPPFEAAVRDAAKLHMDQMRSMMERMQKMREMMTQGAPHEAISPVDRLEAWRSVCPNMPPRSRPSLTPPNPYTQASTTPRRGDSRCLAGS